MAVYSDVYLNLQDPGIINIIKVSQLDHGVRILRFYMKNGSNDWAIPTDCSVTIEGTKPDRNGFDYGCSYSGSTVTCRLRQQMTAVAGTVPCKLIFVDSNNNRISSFLFFLDVEKDAIDNNTVFSTSVLAYAQTVINDLQSIGAYAADLHKKLEFSKYENETLYLIKG